MKWICILRDIYKDFTSIKQEEKANLKVGRENRGKIKEKDTYEMINKKITFRITQDGLLAQLVIALSLYGKVAVSILSQSTCKKQPMDD